MLPTSFQSDPIFHSPLFDQRNSDGSDADMMSGRNPQWARWFDALQGMAKGQGKSLKLGAMDGLPTDNHYATLPLSLQHTPGASYAYDLFGAPIAEIRGNKESADDQAALRDAAQPKPWSMTGAWRSMDFAPFRDPAPLPDPSAKRRK
jgi:hypothetical protein